MVHQKNDLLQLRGLADRYTVIVYCFSSPLIEAARYILISACPDFIQELVFSSFLDEIEW